MTTARIIVGANYGDEGKGTVAATYAKKATQIGKKVLTVMTNGGSQRGHSIITDAGEFTFKHFGSGTAFESDTYFSEYFIVNPMQFCKEYNELKDRGIQRKIFMNQDCKWTTPYDALYNMCIEHARGAERHGTCAMGIWDTINRYYHFGETRSIKFREFIAMPEQFQKNYLSEIRAFYDTLGVPFANDDVKAAWESETMMENFINDCWYMYSRVYFSSLEYLEDKYDELIFENGQGLQLMYMGDNSTPSNTGIHDAMMLIDKSHINHDDVHLHYVTRPYVTKHGYGAFAREEDKKIIAGDINEDRTNHYNEWQGDFRFGKLDIVDLGYRLHHDYSAYERTYFSQFNKHLEVTHCDEMDRVKEFTQNMYGFTINTYDSPKV